MAERLRHALASNCCAGVVDERQEMHALDRERAMIVGRRTLLHSAVMAIDLSTTTSAAALRNPGGRSHHLCAECVDCQRCHPPCICCGAATSC